MTAAVLCEHGEIKLAEAKLVEARGSETPPIDGGRFRLAVPAGRAAQLRVVLFMRFHIDNPVEE